MFKEWSKQFLALCICVITILTPISEAYADEYIPSDNRDDATYYIIEGKDVASLFDFGIQDVDNIVSWIFQFKTYTVIKEYTNEDDNTEYKMYFNTPNLQSIVKNQVISIISDGYTDDTYKVEDTEWVVSVGSNATTENVITKYGFQVPSYTYMGEYPKEVMSVAGILPNPTKWYQVAWRAIKAIFGASFIKAPDSDNFNTITYLNHTYTDKSDYILDFFKKYYLDYFERQIPVHWVDATDSSKKGDYFENADEVIELTVTDDAKNAAEAYNNAHSDEYAAAVARYNYWNKYAAGVSADSLPTTPGVGNVDNLDPWHFMASLKPYKDQFTAWVNAHPLAAYIMVNAITESRQRYGSGLGFQPMTSPASYGLTTTSYTENEDLKTSVSMAADILRYSELHLQANISHTTYTRIETKTTVQTKHYSTDPDTGESHCDFDSGEQYSTSSSGTWTAGTITTEDVLYSTTADWRDDPDYETDAVKGETTHTTSSSSNGSTEIITRVYSTPYTKECDWVINYMWDGKIRSNQMSYYDTYRDFLSKCRFSSLTYNEDDFVPPELQTVYQNYIRNVDLIDKWTKFNEMLARGDDQEDPTSKKEILYRQCMITNEGEDDECWSKKYSPEKTSLTMVNVYAYSRIYTVTQDYDSSQHELTDADAHEIIAKIQNYCGPYSSEVLSNMMKLMCATAKYEGEDDPTTTVISDDPRVMPYDTASMLPVDRANYTTTDPRVEMYKKHIIGKLISNFEINFGVAIFIKPQKTIINIAGKITEFSVFMQQICDFNILDSFGLSPTTMWTNLYVQLMMALLALFFIIKTVIAIVKMGTNAGAKLIVSFLILVFELGLITAIATNPDRTWTTIKNVNSKLMNLGEMSTIYSVPFLDYLYGSASDMEVTYYMPYLDIWSKYNTGYGILDSQQMINSTRDYRELVDKDFPTIDGTEVKHWSILLMDSFSYWGYSNSIANSITVDGHTYNGNTINNNAYRVVDHFMAPRVEVNELSNGNRSITVTRNENYNGEFQSGMVSVLVKLLNCVLCCLLSLIKLLTFIWLWFQLYIFIFKVILGKGAEGKTMGTILIETFSPMIALIFIGMYSGMIMIMGMNADGIIGICLMLFLFWLTFMVIRWWHNLGNQKFFPNTLTWLYMVTNLTQYNRQRSAERLRNEARQNAINAGMDEEYQNMSFEEKCEYLFESDGTAVKAKFANDSRKDKAIEDWYRFAINLKNDPKYSASVTTNPQVLNAMRTLENSEKYKEMTERIKNPNTNKTSYNKAKHTKQEAPKKIGSSEEKGDANNE